MKIKIKIYRYTIKLLTIASLISASLTYSVAQYYSAEEIRELIRKGARRSKRGRRNELILLNYDPE